jgi:hypothetical protein
MSRKRTQSHSSSPKAKQARIESFQLCDDTLALIFHFVSNRIDFEEWQFVCKQFYNVIWSNKHGDIWEFVKINVNSLKYFPLNKIHVIRHLTVKFDSRKEELLLKELKSMMIDIGPNLLHLKCCVECDLDDIPLNRLKSFKTTKPCKLSKNTIETLTHFEFILKDNSESKMDDSIQSLFNSAANSTFAHINCYNFVPDLAKTMKYLSTLHVDYCITEDGWLEIAKLQYIDSVVCADGMISGFNSEVQNESLTSITLVSMPWIYPYGYGVEMQIDLDGFISMFQSLRKFDIQEDNYYITVAQLPDVYLSEIKILNVRVKELESEESEDNDQLSLEGLVDFDPNEFAAYTFRSNDAILAKALHYLFPGCKIEFDEDDADEDEERELSRESVTEFIEKYVEESKQQKALLKKIQMDTSL